MVDYDFYTKHARMLNLKVLALTGDCYYIDTVKPETETLRYNVLTKTVTVWPKLYYCVLSQEIRTETENIEVNTNEGFEEQCSIIQYRLKEIKMKEDF